MENKIIHVKRKESLLYLGGVDCLNVHELCSNGGTGVEQFRVTM